MFHGQANLVLVDVVVTEKDKAVHGLDRSRFHIFEDGKEQTITSFDEHQSASAPVAVKAEPLPPHTYSNTPLYPQTGAVNVLLFDALNTPIENQMQVRKQMVEYMSKIPAGTPLAIFTLSSKLRLITGFTTDAAALVKALKSSKANGQPSALLIGNQGLAGETQTSLDAVTPDTSSSDIVSRVGAMDAVSAMKQFEADQASFQTDVRIDMTIDALQQLAAYLGAIPGRKNVIWFSTAFPLEVFPDLTLYDPFSVVRGNSEQVEKATNMLAAARVALYPVDARGLTVSSKYSAADNSFRGSTALALSGNLDKQRNQQLNDEREKILTEQGAMQKFAADTGGQAFVETNDLEKAIASAIENGSNYYTIGYVPASPKHDGRFHKTEVKVEERKVELAYRHGFFADSAGKNSSNSAVRPSFFAAAVEQGAPQVTEILLKARVLPASDPLFQQVSLPSGPGGEMTASNKGPVHRSIVDLTLDAHGLAFDTAADGTRQGAIHLTMIAYNGDGQRVNYFDHGYQLGVKAAQYEQILSKGIVVRLPIDLPAGPVFLRIAAFDLNSSHAGSLEIPLPVAAQ